MLICSPCLRIRLGLGEDQNTRASLPNLGTSASPKTALTIRQVPHCRVKPPLPRQQESCIKQRLEMIRPALEGTAGGDLHNWPLGLTMRGYFPHPST